MKQILPVNNPQKGVSLPGTAGRGITNGRFLASLLLSHAEKFPAEKAPFCRT
jgi:hypothetical protein